MDEIQTLKSVLNALGQLEVRGKQNHIIVIACMNDIEQIIKGKEENNGDIHAEYGAEKA